MIANINEALIDAGATIINNKTPKLNRSTNRQNQWWNEKCSDEINKRKEAFKKYKENQNQETYENYQKIMTQTKNKLKRIKRKHFKNFAESLNPQKSIADVWKVMHIFEGKNRSPSNGIEEQEMEK